MLRIVTVPDKGLLSPVKPVTEFNDKLVNLIKEMGETLEAQVDPQGVGLAAPQIGVNSSIFVIKPNPKALIEAFINPRIINSQNSLTRNKLTRKSKKQPLEGCLSIPKVWGPVKRNQRVLLEYQTISGTKKTKWFSSFKAIIIQHEIDHLNGVLFTQRALEQKAPLYEEKGDKLEKMEY